MSESKITRKWATKLVGKESCFFSSSTDNLEEDLEGLKKFCIDSGSIDLWRNAKIDLIGHRIRYNHSKDINFEELYLWLKEYQYLDKENAREVIEEVIHLEHYCEGDNSYSAEILELLGGVAASMSPQTFCDLVLTNPPTEVGHHSLHRIRRYVNGASTYLNEVSVLNKNDLAGFISLRLALEGWFFQEDSNGVLEYLQESYNELNESLKSRLNSSLLEGLQCGDVAQDSKKHSIKGVSIGDLACQINEISLAIPVEDRRVKILEYISKLDEEEGDYPPSWAGLPTSFQNKEILHALKKLDDELLWKLIERTWRVDLEGDFWGSRVNKRIQLLIRIYAVSKGGDYFSSLLDDHLEYHRTLGRGLSRSQEVVKHELNKSSGCDSWAKVVNKVLLLLLDSSFASTVRCSIFAISRLIKFTPNAYVELLNFNDLSCWQLKWLLAIGESWIRQDLDFSRANSAVLRNCLLHEDLDIRLQAWLCLSLMQDKPEDLECLSCENFESTPASLDLRDSLHVPDRKHGVLRCTSDFNAAETVLRKISSATGFPAHKFTGQVASWIISIERKTPDMMKWPDNLGDHNDCWTDRNRSSVALNRVLGEVLEKNPIPVEVTPSFAQAYLGAEEPSLFSIIPKDISENSNWPERDDYRNEISESEHKMKMKALAQECDDGWLCIGAEVSAYNHNEDRVLNLWHSISNSNSPIISETTPTTMNGRTFSYLLSENWHELDLKENFMTFKVGGRVFLPWSEMRVYPGKNWIRKYGWNPSKSNPLAWYDGDEIVAKFELFHGTLDSYNQNQSRISMMQRWVVNRTALEKCGVLASLRLHEHYEKAKLPNNF